MTYPILLENYDPLKGQMLRILAPDGSAEKSLDPHIDLDVLKKAYKTMIISRTADQRAVTLQRQGKMGAYPPSRGQEASQLGPVLPLTNNDWLIPGFRELTALIWKGVPMWTLFLYWMGNEYGSKYPEDLKITPPVIPVGDQIPHAVGISYASKLKKEKAVSIVYFGDGGSSEGSFHEGLNLAGVLKTPTIFLCQNNQYAISVPRSMQTASETIAQKAVSYGIPGIIVDGNDILALYVASKTAADRARLGEGPTLIESYTYRIGDHTTSDDARRYRKEEEIKEWEKKDPIKRLQLYLEALGEWDKAEEDKAQEEASKLVDEAVEKALNYPAPSLDDVFKYTYQEMPPHLQKQLDLLQRDLQEEET